MKPTQILRVQYVLSINNIKYGNDASLGGYDEHI